MVLISVATARRTRVVLCAIAMLWSSGCALLGGKHAPVEVCKPRSIQGATALEMAPAWVPGSVAGKNLPEKGICGDGSHHTDRLCVVGEVEGMTSIAQSEGTARQASLRLLGEELDRRLTRVLGTSAPAKDVKDLSKDLRNSIGRVTQTWQAPNCTTYAVAEVKLTDLQFVLRGPQLSHEAIDILIRDAKLVIEPTGP